MKCEEEIRERLERLNSEELSLKGRLGYVKWYNAHRVILDIAKKKAERVTLEWVLNG